MPIKVKWMQSHDSGMPWDCYYEPPVIRVLGRDIDYLWGNLHKGVYDLLPDNHCSICASPIATELCGNHDELYGFRKVYAVGKYIAYPWNYLLSSHIRFFKTHSGLREPLGMALKMVLSNQYPDLLSFDYIVPVPMHKLKLVKRGYNQAGLLGLDVAAHIDIPLADCLIQIKELELRELGRAERLEAVKGAFAFNVEFQETIEDKRILLIDDVVTTGGTASECSQVLMDNGASQVNVIILGRTCDE